NPLMPYFAPHHGSAGQAALAPDRQAGPHATVSRLCPTPSVRQLMERENRRSSGYSRPYKQSHNRKDHNCLAPEQNRILSPPNRKFFSIHGLKFTSANRA